MDDPIRIRGARKHNLKGVDVDFPRRALTVVTGPSGSGKSSLALDTLFAAGQRRYVEALSSYARQFLERLPKPDVDSIDGLCPAIAIERRNPARSARSTVGTATDVHSFLRLLFARVGRTRCPACGTEVRPDTVAGATDTVASLPAGTRFMVGFPLARSEEVSHRLVAENLRAMGFVRVVADGRAARVSELLAAGPDSPGVDASEDGGRGAPDLSRAREVIVVVDRLRAAAAPNQAWRDRVADSLTTCFREGEGEAVVIAAGRGGGHDGDAGLGREPDRSGDAHTGGDAGLGSDAGGRIRGPDPVLRFSEGFRCARHPDIKFPEPQPKLFSFNNPYGSCPTCTGFGATLEYDADLIVPDPSLSLDLGAVDPWAKPRYGRERDALRRFAAREGASVHLPWRELSASFREAVLHGKGSFGGVMAFLRSKEPKRYKQYIRIFLRRYQRPRRCRDCKGARLRPEALRVTVGGRDIAHVCTQPIRALPEWLDRLELAPTESRIAATIVRELSSRVRVLVDVGLGYLTLDRQMRTLSGGEAQRIGLANSLGTRLVDTLYVLDEPSVGLHPHDVQAMLALLRRLRDDGNTVVVVEHNEAAIRASDHVIELGPGAGDQGGSVVFAGSARAWAQDAAEAVPRSGSREDRGGGRKVEAPDLGPGPARGHSPVRARGPAPRRSPSRGHRIRVEGAALHNVAGVDVEFPVGAMTVVTGVSGSGKSTLVHDIVYRALERSYGGGRTSAREHLGQAVGSWRRISGVEHAADVVLVDQSPIGRTPRSNPITYVKAWGEVRRIFAAQPAARAAGLTAGSFSFNVSGGRCQECAGAGTVLVEMVFMADVHVPCDACGGNRYRSEVLAVKVHGKDVADVLDLTVDRAMRFFLREPRLGNALWRLQQVGLGYLRLGQPATHLSGGEAQRLKIARELLKAGGRTVYILDEPTTGLARSEVSQLLKVLGRLVATGGTLIVVEHDPDVIRSADWVIDMGPGAGQDGGRVVAMGTPDDVAATPASVTGRYLAGAGVRQ